MLGLKLNHVSKRGHCCILFMFYISITKLISIRTALNSLTDKLLIVMILPWPNPRYHRRLLLIQNNRIIAPNIPLMTLARKQSHVSIIRLSLYLIGKWHRWTRESVCWKKLATYESHINGRHISESEFHKILRAILFYTVQYNAISHTARHIYLIWNSCIKALTTQASYELWALVNVLQKASLS